jgi:hypothetical protein
MNSHRVYRFWGVMDLMYVLFFLYASLSQGRIPVYDDYFSMRDQVVHFGSELPFYMFTCSLTLIVSVTYTMVLFFRRSRSALLIAYTQIPMRLFLVVPSLSFLPWLIGLFEVRQAALGLFLLFVSEGLKVSSLYKLGKVKLAPAQTH